MGDEVREIVRRVVGRVLSERGRSSVVRASSGGVHVNARPGGAPLRPASPSATPPGGRGPELVGVDALSGFERGASYTIPAGARVTPLALEEARRRGVRMSEERGVRGGRRLVVAVGADHGGFARKAEVLDWLRELGHQPVDLGTRDENAVDYPDFALAVAQAVAEGRADLGVCVDGAGIGSAMAANKVPGVRAANCWDEASARNAREHNFANVLTLGGKMQDAATSERVLRAFLSTPEGAARHARRVAKISAIERRYGGRASEVARVLPERGEG